jgi:hypothetical protein
LGGVGGFSFVVVSSLRESDVGMSFDMG